MNLLEEFPSQPIHEVVNKSLVVGDPTFADEDAEVGDVFVYGLFLSLFQIFEGEAHSAF